VPVPVAELAGNHAPVAPNAASESRPTVDPGRDQWLLDNLRSLGYSIINPALVINSAYQACHLFQQGESPEQVNQQISATTGLNIDDTLQLTSSAMLAYYPDCA
ncbi:MAG: DUF732 domain-containing protein, partial [Mycobacterium sp.]|nr:DUF732 domain-containing protein [Mycobacterium sp.]